MKKSELKHLSVAFDDKFILALIIYALGFAFLCTTVSYIVSTELLNLNIDLMNWMVCILPLILVLFLVYTFGSLVFIGTFAIKHK